MRYGVAVVLSVVVHGLVLFGMVKLMEGVQVGAVKEERISLAYVKVRREERKEVKGKKKVDKKAERKVERVKQKKRTDRVEQKVKEVKEEEAKEEVREEKVEEVEEVIKEEVVEHAVEERGEEEVVAQSGTEEEIGEAEVVGEKTVEEDIRGEESKEGELFEGADYQLEYEEENLGLIREMVRAHLRYPLIARRMGWEGTVVVCFVLTPEGRIEEIGIRESSGHEVLDRSAIEVIRRASKEFPRPKRKVVLLVPIVYRLE